MKIKLRQLLMEDIKIPKIVHVNNLMKIPIKQIL